MLGKVCGEFPVEEAAIVLQLARSNKKSIVMLKMRASLISILALQALPQVHQAPAVQMGVLLVDILDQATNATRSRELGAS